MAYGSVKEVEYQLTIAERLDFAEQDTLAPVLDQATETSKVLHGLIRSLRNSS
jgi:four helix bundle protein